LLANNPDYQINIESFTDNAGSADALEQLTQDRARTLSDRLAAAGVDVTRIQASGMGSANPIAPNTTVASRAKNRRTEIHSEPEQSIAGFVTQTVSLRFPGRCHARPQPRARTPRLQGQVLIQGRKARGIA
jgi:hypothetical protein